MSCEIKNGKNIELTRGDSLYLTYILSYKDGTPYEYHTGDTARFAMKKKIMDETEPPVLVKTLSIDPETSECLLHLLPEDTKNLPMKSKYDYDVEMTYTNPQTGNVDVDTFITNATFTVMPEVV